MKRSNPTILIVDDDVNDLMFIEAAFKALGATSTVQTVNDGDEAIAYLNGDGKYADRRIFGYPDFVITDLKMPGTDGFGLLEHVRHNPESATIPTVMLSGSQDHDDIKKAYLLGANSYHVKPSSPTALRALARALHDYWMLCELPEVDERGKQLKTEGGHKLGERLFRPGH
jgi:CheY-like chemotaxis protein